MFTGTVKLAQIDDYISPSQSCIQPKIMKPDTNQQKATVTLNDCLACSGCITSAESVLIEQMSLEKLLNMSNQENGEQIFVVISAQALASLAKYYKVTLGQCMDHLENVLKKLSNFTKLYELALATKLCHELIFQQFITKFQSKRTPVLCSQCPGWVCYSQKTLTAAVTELMSEIKSPQQIMAQMLRKKYGTKCRVVSIMPCYDKKLQAIRFQYQDNNNNNQTKNNIVKQVDLTLATIEIVELIKKINGGDCLVVDKNNINSLQTSPKNKPVQTVNNNQQKVDQKSNTRQQLQFVVDQTSNGYIEFLLSRLGIKQCTRQQIKNSDFVQYTFEWQGSTRKMAKCYGFRNLQKIVQQVKKNKCPYLYIEVMACPGGCYGGGGQIKYQAAKNKQIINELEQMIKQYPQISGQNKYDIEKYDIDRTRTQVKYKPIEKTLSQSVLNW